MRYDTKQASLLILALWTLALLTAFSIYLGAGVRQRMILVQRLETRHRLYLAAASGIRKAMSLIQATRLKNEAPFSNTPTRNFLMNNPKEFSSLAFEGASVDIFRTTFSKTFHEKKKHYGMIDESSKTNINTADVVTLTRLLSAVLGLKTDEAKKTALAIIDWRSAGRSTLKGFFSQDYYKNLRFPYEPKGNNFEILDELLLVEGVSLQAYERLRYFVTVYGSGQVNVNTASAQVLHALGLSFDTANSVIDARRGQDGLEATSDDLTFHSVEEFLTAMRRLSAFSDSDVLALEQMHRDDKLAVSSDFYFFESLAYTSAYKQQMGVYCVYDALAGKIVYWQEF